MRPLYQHSACIIVNARDFSPDPTYSNQRARRVTRVARPQHSTAPDSSGSLSDLPENVTTIVGKMGHGSNEPAAYLSYCSTAIPNF